MQAAGVRTILLKGPALGALLNRGREVRVYSDVDLLVDPAQFSVAAKILVGQNFRRFDPEAPVQQTDPSVGSAIGVQGASHAVAWLREHDSFVIDLHDSLPQVGVTETVVWQHITQHLDAITVAGVRTETLDRPASALLVALHAAHHGPDWDRATSDLERALDIFDSKCWEAARELAVKLEADIPMGIGLGLSEAGRALALQLSLPTEPGPARRLLWAGAPWSATVVDWVSRQEDLRAAIRLIARIIWPTPLALRRGSALARRGRRGLMGAYALRSFHIARQLPGAIRARRRARS